MTTMMVSTDDSDDDSILPQQKSTDNDASDSILPRQKHWKSSSSELKELLVDIQGTLKTLVIKLDAIRSINKTDECDSKHIVCGHRSISGPLELLGLFISLNKRSYIFKI